MVDKIDRQEMAAIGFRTCVNCGRTKMTDRFYADRVKCKTCVLTKARSVYAEKTADIPKRIRVRQPDTPEKKAERQAKAFLRRMNITIEERDAIFEAQGSACAICRSTDPHGPTWCTDHDHSCCPASARSCGSCIRGVLCFRCNTLLGHAKDSIQNLRGAIEYLTTWEQKRG